MATDLERFADREFESDGNGSSNSSTWVSRAYPDLAVMTGRGVAIPHRTLCRKRSDGRVSLKEEGWARRKPRRSGRLCTRRTGKLIKSEILIATSWDRRNDPGPQSSPRTLLASRC